MSDLFFWKKSMLKVFRWSALLLGITISHLTNAQQITIRGQVIDNDGFSLPGATVAVKGSFVGTTTDPNGNYALKVNPNDTLIFSFVGFITKVLPVNNQTQMDVVLAFDVQKLDEVVVVGYGTVRKSDLTGAVGSVDVGSIQKQATADVIRTMQGKVAGVQVTSNSGAPGTGTTVRVRGVGSFAGADPLYVVDGFLTGDISNISANDIESMEVLKDASATAIYGSRGSNGVIIITTKKGVKDGFNIELNAYAGVQQAWKTLDMLNAEDYALLYLESLGGPGATSLSLIDVSDKRSWIQDALSGNIEETDWQEEVLRESPVQSYDISFRGGVKGLQYKLSGSYFDQQGIVENTYGKRYQAQGNLSYDISKSINIAAGVKYALNDYVNYQQDTYGSILGTALRKDPINPVRDEITGNWDRTGLTDISNPARLAYEQQFKTSVANRIQPNISATIKFLDGFTFNSSVQWDDRVVDTENYTPSNITVQSRVLDENNLPSRSPNESFSGERRMQDERILEVFQNTNTLSYNKEHRGHSINTVIGLEAYKEFTSFNRDQVYTDSVDNIQFQERRYNLLSYFVRAVYSFKDRYLFTGTLRRDGSSKFPEDGRWGTFPSFSLGWNVDRESFFPSTDFITGLKIRGGWGQVGNQGPIAPYSFRSTLAPGWSYAFDNATAAEGYAATSLPASTITWETSEMTNFGVDMHLLDDRLSATLDVFNKQTNDLLVDTRFMPSPTFSGAQAPSSNAASMKNDGMEITLGFKQSINEFSFNIGGNIAFINNEVTSLGAGESIEGANYEPKIGMPVTRTIVGESFGTFYGLKALGIFQTAEEVNAHLAVNEQGQPIDQNGEVVSQGSPDQALIQQNAQPGDVIYQDTNFDGQIDSDDAVAIGSPHPDFTYGFYFTAEYKAFDLSISFTGVQGNEIANVFSYYINGPSALDNNMLSSRLDRWTGPGTSNTQPRVTVDNTQNHLFSDLYIEDGSFMRLRNIQLGYTVPVTALKKLKLQQVRVYLSADNLLTFTKYSGFDPEIGLPYYDPFAAGVDLGTYPQARTIIFGTNIKF